MSLVAPLLILATLWYTKQASAQESTISGTHLFIEQDLLARMWGSGSDENYTMGVGIQSSGSWVRRSPVAFLHFGLDRGLGLTGLRLTPDYTKGGSVPQLHPDRVWLHSQRPRRNRAGDR